MALDAETKQRLDHYARLARAEFEKNCTKWDAAGVARWWNKWCVPEKTNHDRLGWILIDPDAFHRGPAMARESE